MTKSAALYRTVWRWHFYAGLLVAPFMLFLAATGAIYLFNDEINDVLQREMRLVPVSTHDVSPSRIVENVLAAFPDGRVTRLDTPSEPGRSVQVFLDRVHGEPLRIFVDPGTGEVLGSYVYAHTLVGFADVAHGSLMLGGFGDAIVELAACWGLILVVTGLYLWWPRGGWRITGVLIPRWSASGRTFWKSLHATTGIWTALLILFLIVTGLPWASNWGGLFRRVTEAAGVGYPTSYATHQPPKSTTTVAEMSQRAAPWTLEAAPAPSSSDPHAGHHAELSSGMATGEPIGIDKAASIVAGEGMKPPYRLSLPKGRAGVYAAFTYPDRPQGQRTLYIDQYSGRVIGDVRFADYGPAAKAVELGVQLHMGNYFGRANQIVMLIPCLGIMVLTLTGPYLWWRRRPKGSWGAPQAITYPKVRTVAIITIALCLVLPLAAISLAVVWILDSLLSRLLDTDRRRFAS